MEIISQRRNANGDTLHLDHWGYGAIDQWSVFYDPALLDGGSNCGCTDEVVGNLTDSGRTAAKAPLALMAPCEVGQWAYSNVVCSAIYVDGPNGRGWDEKHLGNRGAPGPWGNRDPVALVFARTGLLEWLQDVDMLCNIAHLRNEYFTTACLAVDLACEDAQIKGKDDPRCEEMDETWRGKRWVFKRNPVLGEITGEWPLVPLEPTPAAGTPTPTPEACSGCELSWCMDRSEDYWLRYVPDDSPLENGEYRRSGGFLGFLWVAHTDCAIDECPFWYIDPIGGAASMATPTAGPTPTAGGATSTPLPIEHEKWRTRCPAGDCVTATPDPSATAACIVPVPTVATGTPGGGPDYNQCYEVAGPGTPTAVWPPQSTALPTPVRTQPPYPTPVSTRVGVPFPTDPAAMCEPTATATSTPTITLTPTNTATPTSTPSPSATPHCATDSGQRQCPNNPSWACSAGCVWSYGPLTLGSWNCGGQYQVRVVAERCSQTDDIDWVKVRWSEDNATWTDWQDMTEQGAEWHYSESTSDRLPTYVQLKWSYNMGTYGLKKFAVWVGCSGDRSC